MDVGIGAGAGTGSTGEVASSAYEGGGTADGAVGVISSSLIISDAIVASGAVSAIDAAQSSGGNAIPQTLPGTSNSSPI